MYKVMHSAVVQPVDGFPLVYLLSMTPDGLEYPWVSWGQLS